MKKFEIEVIKKNNQLVFSNFDSVKKWIEDGIEEYRGKTYINIDEASKDKEVLESVKEKIETVKKEVKKPYADVEKQLDSLLKIIKEPISDINKFEKELKQKALKEKIMSYAEGVATSLGGNAEKVLNSNSFFEDQWLLTSKFPEKKWKEAINEKIVEISKDINTISRTGGDKANSLLAVYFETLSMDSVKNFVKNVSDDIEIGKEIDEIDKVVGFNIIKIYGTSSQMSQIFDELELLGIDFEILEEGMPKEQKELYEPSFDSFVAFDIEHSGTYGVAYGDGPAEITEIGAVKVINGKVVDQIDLLMNPGRKITKRNEKLTRITNEMVKNEPPVSVRIKEFKDFIGDMVLVGHNIKTVDLPFINLAGKKNGIAFENPFFDTYTYAKKFKEEKGWDNVKLEYLAGQFGIEDPGHHRADNDAKVNVDVYFKLKDL